MKERIQLFCIPYAGGNAELFDELAGLFSDNVEVIKIEYAGHGTRRKESYYTDFQMMVQDVADIINEKATVEAKTAVFGYSMGSIVAYELFAQDLLHIKPSYMFFASHESPDTEWESKKYFRLGDEDFFEMIQQMGGFEKCSLEMLKNRFFRKLHFDPVKADYELLGKYKMSKRVIVDVPSILFYSSKDIPTDRIVSWEPFLGEYGKTIELGENHFFIREYAELMVDIMGSLVYKEV